MNFQSPFCTGSWGITAAGVSARAGIVALGGSNLRLGLVGPAEAHVLLQFLAREIADGFAYVFQSVEYDDLFRRAHRARKSNKGCRDNSDILSYHIFRRKQNAVRGARELYQTIQIKVVQARASRGLGGSGRAGGGKKKALQKRRMRV